MSACLTIDPREAYLDFLRAKLPQAERAGFEPPSPPHWSLTDEVRDGVAGKPHQGDLCRWAIRGGRRGIFASFGLGKTRMHLQLAKWVTEETGGRFLIICPLGVRQEFTKSDGPAMGIDCTFVRSTEEIRASNGQIFITNYESVREEKHVCPLQLDVIRRIVTRWSNPGEVVFDPFGGIGSVPERAIRLGRIGWMTELSETYWKCAVHYCESAEAAVDAPTLMDLLVDNERGAA